jgi:hypothetical protein
MPNGEIIPEREKKEYTPEELHELFLKVSETPAFHDLVEPRYNLWLQKGGESKSYKERNQNWRAKQDEVFNELVESGELESFLETAYMRRITDDQTNIIRTNWISLLENLRKYESSTEEAYKKSLYKEIKKGLYQLVTDKSFLGAFLDVVELPNALNDVIIFTDHGRTNVDEFLRDYIVKIYANPYKAWIEADMIRDCKENPVIKTKYNVRDLPLGNVVFEYIQGHDKELGIEIKKAGSITIYPKIKGKTFSKLLPSLEEIANSSHPESKDAKELFRHLLIKDIKDVVEYQLHPPHVRKQPEEGKEQGEYLLDDVETNLNLIKKDILSRYKNSVIQILTPKDNAEKAHEIENVASVIEDDLVLNLSTLVRYKEVNLRNTFLTTGNDSKDVKQIVRETQNLQGKLWKTLDDRVIHTDFERTVPDSSLMSREDLTKNQPKFFYEYSHYLEDFFHIVSFPGINIDKNLEETLYCFILLKKAKETHTDKEVCHNIGKLMSRKILKVDEVRDYVDKSSLNPMSYHLMKFCRNIRWANIIKNRHLNKSWSRIDFCFKEMKKCFKGRDYLNFRALLREKEISDLGLQFDEARINELIDKLDHEGHLYDYFEKGKVDDYKLALKMRQDEYIDLKKEHNYLGIHISRAKDSLEKAINLATEYLNPSFKKTRNISPFNDFDKTFSRTILYKIDKKIKQEFRVERTSKGETKIYNKNEEVPLSSYPLFLNKLAFTSNKTLKDFRRLLKLLYLHSSLNDYENQYKRRHYSKKT